MGVEEIGDLGAIDMVEFSVGTQWMWGGEPETIGTASSVESGARNACECEKGNQSDMISTGKSSIW